MPGTSVRLARKRNRRAATERDRSAASSPRTPGERNPSARRARENRKALSPLVLIAEDFLDVREMYAEILRFHGYRTVEAGDGLEAVGKARAEDPAIILMDLAMPVMDGIEAIRRIRADRRTHRIPIIVITGHAVPSMEVAARTEGCDSFLAKPVHPQELLGEIRRVLESQGSPPPG